jgi:gliding motility-associated-like protein
LTLIILPAGLYAQPIKHSYRFNNDFSVAPPQCGPDLTQEQALGSCASSSFPGSFITDVLPLCGVSRTVYHTNLHWGLAYPNTVGTITTTYTIHLYVKTTTWGSHPWVRIIDFSNGASDQGIYYRVSPSSTDHCLDFYPSGIVGTCPYFNNSTYYLLTFTRNGATGIIDVYVNNTLFVSYNDATGRYTSVPGRPVYIYRDDQAVPCESGEANFAYLSFTNLYSSQATVDSVYNSICPLANTDTSAAFSINPSFSCDSSRPVAVTYTGDIPAPGSGYTFNWNWGGANVISGSGMGPYTVQWNASGTYPVQLTITNNTCGNVVANTQQITIGSVTRFTIDTSICQGHSYLGYNLPGTYIDTLHHPPGCDSIRTLDLIVLPSPSIIEGHSLCPGQTYLGYSSPGTYIDTFAAANGCDSIRTLVLMFNPGSTSTTTQSICEGTSFWGHNATGTYVDTLTATNGCDSLRTLDLTVIKKPTPDLGPDRILCSGDTVMLHAGTFNSYLWQDGTATAEYVVAHPGTFSVTVTNNCGNGTDNVVVTESNCDIYFPSGFTPDNNGRNDLFKMLNAYRITEFKLSVYNRWGEKIFETSNPLEGWNGTFKDKKQDSGVYVWYCSFKKNNKKEERRGTVVLIR